MNATTQRSLPRRAGTPASHTGPVRRAPRAGAAQDAPRTGDPRRFATRLKGWSLGITLVGLGVTWGLVSQNVVGATNAAQPAAAAPASGTSGRAAVPSADFFGQPATQPRPILGNGGSVSGGGPIVRSGSS